MKKKALGKMNTEKFSELQQKAEKKVEEQFLEFLDKNELEIVRRHNKKMRLKKYKIPTEEVEKKFKEIEDWSPII